MLETYLKEKLYALQKVREFNRSFRVFFLYYDVHCSVSATVQANHM